MPGEPSVPHRFFVGVDPPGFSPSEIIFKKNGPQKLEDLKNMIFCDVS